jgi:hypothetical protein
MISWLLRQWQRAVWQLSMRATFVTEGSISLVLIYTCPTLCRVARQHAAIADFAVLTTMYELFRQCSTAVAAVRRSLSGL